MDAIFGHFMPLIVALFGKSIQLMDAFLMRIYIFNVCSAMLSLMRVPSVDDWQLESVKTIPEAYVNKYETLYG